MLEQIFLHQKNFSQQLRKESLALRLEHLKSLELMLEKHQDEITDAIMKDFSKPPMETKVTEIYPLLSELYIVQKQLHKWMKPVRTHAPLFLKGTRNSIQYEPRGVCLIIAPWNYPLFLTIGPLISALAAGNTAFVKPSDMTPHTSRLLAQLIKATFNEEHVTVIEGGHTVVDELMKLPFDHVFFTGSTRVGKLIMESASKNLSSITLELGGKSPTIIDGSANLDVAADKILWAKFVNAGQTCVAPDYLFIQESIHHTFVELLSQKLQAIYGATAEQRKSSPDFARMITVQHATRQKTMLEEALGMGAKIIVGGEVDEAQRFVSPTLIENVDVHCALMKEEIFGPVLPIMTFKELSEVIHFINDRPKPLALYYYSHSEIDIERMVRETSAGGVCINDSVVHLGNSFLPFGGVGDSGMGTSHGIYGFRNFSHGKAILRQGWTGKFLSMMFPPYTAKKKALVDKLIRWKI